LDCQKELKFANGSKKQKFTEKKQFKQRLYTTKPLGTESSNDLITLQLIEEM
jgi:hypothetical protein